MWTGIVSAVIAGLQFARSISQRVTRVEIDVQPHFEDMRGPIVLNGEEIWALVDVTFLNTGSRHERVRRVWAEVRERRLTGRLVVKRVGVSITKSGSADVERPMADIDLPPGSPPYERLAVFTGKVGKVNPKRCRLVFVVELVAPTKKIQKLVAKSLAS